MARKYLLVDISQRGEYILHVYDKEIIDWLIELGKKQSEYNGDFRLYEKDYLMFKLKWGNVEWH